MAICIKVTSKAASNGLNADDERVMTSPVGSAEEIGKLRRLQELVDLSVRAISNRISSGSYTLVSVAGFDDPALRLFATCCGIFQSLRSLSRCELQRR